MNIIYTCTCVDWGVDFSFPRVPHATSLSPPPTILARREGDVCPKKSERSVVQRGKTEKTRSVRRMLSLAGNIILDRINQRVESIYSTVSVTPSTTPSTNPLTATKAAEPTAAQATGLATQAAPTLAAAAARNGIGLICLFSTLST